MSEIEPNYDALTMRITSGNLPVMRLHYAAHALSNPKHEEGMAWLMKALSGYKGIEDPDWLKEMEIMYSAGGGAKIFPNWQDWLRDSNIFIDGVAEMTHSTSLYGSYDHGYANPACYLVHAIEPDGMRRTLWEFYGDGVPLSDISRIIKGERVTLHDGRTFEGNPYAGKEKFKITDPSIFRDDQVMERGPNKSIAYLFTREGVHFLAGSKGDDATVAGWLTGTLWADPAQPEYQIHRSCTNLIWELGRLQRKKLTAIQRRTRNDPEDMVDKDNHAWDALKYWLKRFPVGSTTHVKPTQEADFTWWRDLKKKSGVAKSYVRDFAR